jgi:HSP20 family protein
MTSLIRWGRSPMLNLQRDLDDLFEDFSAPRSLRREIERLFDEAPSTRSMWREMDRLLSEFASPLPLRRRIERLFESFGALKPSFGRGRAMFVPSLDVTEQENEYVLKADLPGVREQDVELRVDDDNVLTVRGERKEEETKHARGYEYLERSYGAFSRSVELPRGVDTAKIEADFRNGVLEIHIPKTEAARTRKIPVGREREEPKVIPPPPSNGPKAQPSS